MERIEPHDPREAWEMFREAAEFNRRSRRVEELDKLLMMRDGEVVDLDSRATGLSRIARIIPKPLR